MMMISVGFFGELVSSNNVVVSFDRSDGSFASPLSFENIQSHTLLAVGTET
jgi:hypothetical protein